MKKCKICNGEGVIGFLLMDEPSSKECHACEGSGDEPCDHDGWVIKDECERCGERGLRSDQDIFEEEAPR